ncbi:DUF6326 family protein [Luteibacter sp. 22Crub2.1]|uniref:DUF6326 family protein n=1 Tax=Luteibacter sp. 22Crub2.1 TaxID=1283288 RepID=UPI0009A7D1FD|nr:DUF6326 family protein [Luteibacter sp. 22Crub2.1]SKB30891.1 hypothetical protein SAMN05660880_00490 [Luteibacter sp. 22Crub2.1]
MALPSFEDPPVPVRLKLAALWTSLMSCYIYGDYFGLYVPGKLQGVLNGDGPIGPTSQGTLVGASMLLAAPALMIALSLLLPVRACRIVTIILGIFYTLVMAATMTDAWWFYKAMGVIEMTISLITVGLAWRWPRVASTV